ncbi:MAG TPA: hypothetical protein VFW83_10260, partial [Bryobacteraceae bacterium]|nr:hypothetical protein [Bryobacteraceae bacterium]
VAKPAADRQIGHSQSSTAPIGRSVRQHHRLALRRFRPPCLAQVWCDREERPAKLSSSQGTGRVVACGGPWRTSGDWWSGSAWDRDEWDIEISTGELLRIHRDRSRKLWFVEGSYD